MTLKKDIHKLERPREKLEKYGVRKVSDAELLAIVLGSGIKDLHVLELSKNILRKITNTAPNAITLESLLLERGLGKAKAMQILAMLELGHRLQQSKSAIEILTARDVWKLCADIRDSKREHCVAFYLDTQGQLIERHIISIGTLNESLVHPREVFEPAVTLHAASVIVVHNHPSGKVTPSPEDIQITHRLRQAGRILGITLLDHLILTKDTFASIKDRDE
jgi:DNA repair protein RadC